MAIFAKTNKKTTCTLD